MNTERHKKLGMLFDKKLLLLEQYLGFTRQMQAMEAAGEVRNLRDFLAKRQHCIHQIAMMDTSIKGWMQPDLGGTGGEHEETFRSAVVRYRSGMREMLERIDALDRNLVLRFKENCDGIRQDILTMRSVRRAAGGYGSKGDERNHLSSKFISIRE